MSKKKIIAIIPARGGSKSIKNKNIANLFGKPLIYHSIKTAKDSKLIQKIIVSTDSNKIRSIALKYGAEVPFLRPKKLAKDSSKDFGVINHAIKWLEKKQNYYPDLIVHLRPTYPMRNVRFIDKNITLALKQNDFDAMKTVVETSQTPFKMWYKKNNRLKPVLGNLKKEYFNFPRQLLKKTYWQNACLDIINPKTLKQKKSISGRKIIPIVMDKSEVYDVDDKIDLIRIKKKFKV